MRTPSSELIALKSICAGAELLGEGERTFALLPALKVTVAGTVKTVTALLQPWNGGDGYTTRLYFSEAFREKGANWNVFSLLGRTWHACSWNNVPADLPWVQILQCHLQVLR